MLIFFVTFQIERMIPKGKRRRIPEGRVGSRGQQREGVRETGRGREGRKEREGEGGRERGRREEGRM